MNGFRAVFKRELKGYFATPVAYVFLVIFLFAAGYMTFQRGFFEMRQADMTIFFKNLPLLFAFMAPAVAMRLWAGMVQACDTPVYQYTIQMWRRDP